MRFPCIIGQRIGKNGYARLPSGKRGAYLYAHRVVYESFHGEIPKGMHVHHICKNPACINIMHLKLLSPKEHKAEHPQPRKCDHENRRIDSRGKSECRECRRQNERERYQTDPEFRAKKIARSVAYKRRQREEVLS
jgi:HNH endonuclease